MIIPALIVLSALAASPDGASVTESQAVTAVEPGVAWYGDWDAALAEAERSQRPIMLYFVRPACQGVSGVF